MKVIIPFKLRNPKTRLSRILSLEERIELAKNMLMDVLDAVRFISDDITVLCPTGTYLKVDVNIEEDDAELSEAVNRRLRGETAVIMSDLPLISSEILKRFVETEGDVVIAPGRRGGTNMLLVRDSRFRVSYHYGSFLKHVSIAKRLGLKVSVFDSFYASVDVDDEADLLELMLHGEGKRSKAYLESIGFRVDFSEKDPKLIRVCYKHPPRSSLPP